MLSTYHGVTPARPVTMAEVLQKATVGVAPTSEPDAFGA